MEEKIKTQNLQRLDINDNIIKILNENKIMKIGQLCTKTKSDLRALGITNSEINQVDIELQLLGLCLKGNI